MAIETLKRAKKNGKAVKANGGENVKSKAWRIRATITTKHEYTQEQMQTALTALSGESFDGEVKITRVRPV